jgi:hypothetical protein
MNFRNLNEFLKILIAKRILEIVAPGGVKALTGGPQRAIEEADRWDPTIDIF